MQSSSFLAATNIDTDVVGVVEAVNGLNLLK